MMEFFLKSIENVIGYRRKYWLPTHYPFMPQYLQMPTSPGLFHSNRKQPFRLIPIEGICRPHTDG